MKKLLIILLTIISVYAGDISLYQNYISEKHINIHEEIGLKEFLKKQIEILGGTKEVANTAAVYNQVFNSYLNSQKSEEANEDTQLVPNVDNIDEYIVKFNSLDFSYKLLFKRYSYIIDKIKDKNKKVEYLKKYFNLYGVISREKFFANKFKYLFLNSLKNIKSVSYKDELKKLEKSESNILFKAYISSLLGEHKYKNTLADQLKKDSYLDLTHGLSIEELFLILRTVYLG